MTPEDRETLRRDNQVVNNLVLVMLGMFLCMWVHLVWWTIGISLLVNVAGTLWILLLTRRMTRIHRKTP